MNTLFITLLNVLILPEAFGQSGVAFRLAFGSCNNPLEGADIWSSVLSTQPHALLLLGDNIYADTNDGMGHYIPSTAENIASIYNTLESTMSFKSLVDGVGGWDNILAVYDDHDYGVNNGDKTYEHRNASMELFWNFTNVPVDSPLRWRNGVYSSKTFHVAEDFVMKILTLDVRSNKDSRYKANGDFLGAEQWFWLQRELQDASVNLILIGSPIQVLPSGKVVEESWHEFPRARESLLRLVNAARQYVDVVILSGDIHVAEVLKARCEGHSEQLWEFTSSGLTESPHLISRFPGPGETGDGDSGIILEPFHSFGWVYSMYQAVAGTYYRENRFGDHFNGINFGVLDIVPTDNGYYALNVHILNHRREVVIEKHVTLRSPYERRERPIGARNILQPLEAIVPAGDSHAICTGIHGDLPKWRTLLAFVALAVLPVALLVATAYALRWLVARVAQWIVQQLLIVYEYWYQCRYFKGFHLLLRFMAAGGTPNIKVKSL